MRKILTASFFNRDTSIVAQELLGTFLVRKIGNKEIAAMITQTESYDGLHDLASHASKGRTTRTEVMFGKPGIFYVYLCYGMYFMLNVVTREYGYPAAVLIRGVQGYNGPGKLTKFFGIDKSLNGLVAEKSTGLWFEDRGVAVSKSHIQKLPRMGVAYAGPVWSAKKLRFVLLV
jgi:DNA-3-methyladenine glycosylase